MKYLLPILIVFSFLSCKKEETSEHIPVQGLVTINSQAQLTSEVSSGVSFLFFHASWCSVCNAMRPDVTLTAEDSELSTVFFGEVEYDDHTDIVNAQNVSGFPTVLIFKDGVEVDRMTGGGHTYEELKQAVQAQL